MSDKTKGGWTPDEITAQEFNDTLGRYSCLIQAISETKGAKHGQKTLSELDEFRYVTAPGLFGPGEAGKPMELDDIKTLVDWKLRHGKFRPMLMKLVSSNDGTTARDTVRDAIAQYRRDQDTVKAVEALSKLRGIGPATASLLLAVHDPDRVIFFADEAFYWLCCGGRRSSIKYNAKEYQQLDAATQQLRSRLVHDGEAVKAIDVERVAFVLMNHQEDDATQFPPNGDNADTTMVDNAAAAAPSGFRGRKTTRPAQPLRRKSSDDKKRKQRGGSEGGGDTLKPLAKANGGVNSVVAGDKNADEDGGVRRSKRGKRV